MEKEKSISMPVINEHAAGIDVGSSSHYVAIGQSAGDVCKFSVYTKDNIALVEHLRANGIKTVAMESTGTYWQTLYNCLQEAGFEVVLSNNYIKDPQKKTDTKDARWLQRLHTLGLLKGAFIPTPDVECIRAYHRHRDNIVALASASQQRMQKALRLMNVRLDVALSDITGLSGMKMLEAIVNGERSGEKLALLAHGTVKKTQQEIADALQGQWKDEQLFILADELEAYKNYQKRMAECDKKIEKLLKEVVERLPVSNTPVARSAKHPHIKNRPHYDVETLSMKYFGVNLLTVEGIGENTVMTFISEIGTDILKFPTKKNFTSWLRLAPNNKKTGDKTMSSRTPKGKSIMANAFRLAANTIAQRRSGVLKKIFVRITLKKGRAAAITALARRLAEIFWIMTVKKVPYKCMNEEEYFQKIKMTVIKNIRTKMKKLSINTDELIFEGRVSNSFSSR
jgi:transposase